MELLLAPDGTAALRSTAKISDLIEALKRLDPEAKCELLSFTPMTHFFSETLLTDKNEPTFPRTLRWQIEVEQLGPWPKAD